MIPLYYYVTVLIHLHRHTVSPMSTLATPDARFDHLHVDIVV